MCCNCQCNIISNLENQIENLKSDKNYYKQIYTNWRDIYYEQEIKLNKLKSEIKSLKTTIKTLISVKEEENGTSSSK